MLSVNEHKTIELVESLFMDILKNFELMKDDRNQLQYPRNEIGQLQAIVSILELPLDVDSLVAFLENNNSISSFLAEKSARDFLIWLHEAKLWMYTDADKYRDFESFGIAKNHVKLPIKVTVWHNNNCLKYRLLELQDNCFPETIFIKEIQKVAVLQAFSLEEAWTLTQHLERPWHENPDIEVIHESRSTDIGDILEVGNNDCYIVASKGFKKIAIAY